MKRIAFLLALVLCFSCFVGIIASAEGDASSAPAAEPSLDIAFYTVPINACEASIVFAVKAEGWENNGEFLHLQVKRGAEDFKHVPDKTSKKGTCEIGGEKYIILQYDLEVYEMDVVITARAYHTPDGETVVSGTEVTTSVNLWAKAYKDNGGQYGKLVDAMTAYGAAVKAYQPQ